MERSARGLLARRWWRTLCYNALVGSVRHREHAGLDRVWRSAWTWARANCHGPVDVTIHGTRATVNFGYTYPLNARLYSTYNDPLIGAVRLAFALRTKPISFVDVGAAVGDTVLLVAANCPGMLGEFLCVDGDEEFLRYLEANVAALPGAHVEGALLSAGTGSVREMVRIHAGTASAQGALTDRAVPFDTVFARSGLSGIDVLKIDVDGFDGVVIAGAQDALRTYRPIVVFEWHPGLCRSTARDWMEHWGVLRLCGYTHTVWFTKYGGFSHFGATDETGSIQDLARFCLAEHLPDWHYDVVAFPEERGIDPVDFAALVLRERKVSRW